MPGKAQLDAFSTFAKMLVRHAHFQKAYEQIVSAIALHGTDDEVANEMLTGPAGTGKTTLKKLLTQAHPVIEDGVTIEAPGCPASTTDYVLLLAFEFPSQPTVINVARSTLKVLSDPRWNTGDREKLKERVTKAIRQSRTKAVFGDEAQRLVDRNGDVARDDLADFIKELRAETRAIFILVGLGRLERLVTKDWQIGRRWNASVRLLLYQPYDYGTFARTATTTLTAIGWRRCTRSFRLRLRRSSMCIPRTTGPRIWRCCASSTLPWESRATTRSC